APRSPPCLRTFPTRRSSDLDRGALAVTSVELTTFRTGDTPLPDVVILTHKLTRDYDMGGEVVHALRGVNIQIKRNEFVAVMGPRSEEHTSELQSRENLVCRL